MSTGSVFAKLAAACLFAWLIVMLPVLFKIEESLYMMSYSIPFLVPACLLDVAAWIVGIWEWTAGKRKN